MPWYTSRDSFRQRLCVWTSGTAHNAFIRDGDRAFRTYFINGRGDEAMGTVWSYLDMTALGRQELWEDSPEGYPQTAMYKWWNWHDNYDAEATPNQKWVQVSRQEKPPFERKTDSEVWRWMPSRIQNESGWHPELFRASPQALWRAPRRLERKSTLPVDPA